MEIEGFSIGPVIVRLSYKPLLVIQVRFICHAHVIISVVICNQHGQNVSLLLKGVSISKSHNQKYHIACFERARLILSMARCPGWRNEAGIQINREVIAHNKLKNCKLIPICFLLFVSLNRNVCIIYAEKVNFSYSTTTSLT